MRSSVRVRRELRIYDAIQRSVPAMRGNCLDMSRDGMIQREIGSMTFARTFSKSVASVSAQSEPFCERLAQGLGRGVADHSAAGGLNLGINVDVAGYKYRGRAGKRLNYRNRKGLTPRRQDKKVGSGKRRPFRRAIKRTGPGHFVIDAEPLGRLLQRTVQSVVVGTAENQ